MVVNPGSTNASNNLSLAQHQPMMMEGTIQEQPRPDRKKSHWELTMEIEELKKKKNRDLEDIKKLKVELHKMELMYKKYRELCQQGSGGMGLVNLNIAATLSFSLNQPGDPAEVA
jgi:hypothetical protein